MAAKGLGLAREKSRLADLDRRIEACRQWGACLSEMDAEARGLRRLIEQAEAEHMMRVVLTA